MIADESETSASGIGLGDQLAEPALVGRIRVGMEQADGQCRDALGARGLDRGPGAVLVQRGQHLAGVEHPLVDLERQLAWHERRGALREPVVELGPILAADLEDVAEAARDQEAAANALALQERVRRDGRPMDEELDVGGGPPGSADDLDDPLLHADRLVGRRGRGLREREAVGGRIEQHEVGERPSDVHPETQAHGGEGSHAAPSPAGRATTIPAVDSIQRTDLDLDDLTLAVQRNWEALAAHLADEHGGWFETLHGLVRFSTGLHSGFLNGVLSAEVEIDDLPGALALTQPRVRARPAVALGGGAVEPSRRPRAGPGGAGPGAPVAAHARDVGGPRGFERTRTRAGPGRRARRGGRGSRHARGVAERPPAKSRPRRRDHRCLALGTRQARARARTSRSVTGSATSRTSPSPAPPSSSARARPASTTSTRSSQRAARASPAPSPPSPCSRRVSWATGTACSAASELGEPVYRRLGFRELPPYAVLVGGPQPV